MFRSKQVLFLLTLTMILITAVMVLYLNYNPDSFTPKSELDSAVNQAKHLFSLRKEGGENFLSGPCLSDSLMKGWVVDIVHSPRQPIDNLVQNQCPSFLDGRAIHFVELDIEGNFVRAK